MNTLSNILIALAASLSCVSAAQGAAAGKVKQQQTLSGYTNPVIDSIADAGVIRHAGKYYLGGVRTYGDFFVSSDLVNWNKRVHVFDLDNDWTHGTGARNNQVHADDISYSGGLFHLLFSVNYWGDDRHIVHITHATSPSVTGPYREVRSDQWFENRIDPQVFRDEDGRLYLYMVKFTDGNTVWGRPMRQDFSFAGDAVCQFSSQPGTWETMDNRVAEGPFVVKYRGRYYMMYNANHTSPEYGNYRLGVCEAASPLAFGPGGKYPWPVVGPQTEALADTSVNLLCYGSGSYVPLDLASDTIAFTLASVPKALPHLLIAQRGGCELTLNGRTLNPSSPADYRLIRLPEGLLRQGCNLISVVRKPGASLVGLALYDSERDISGDLLLTPGQPNIVRGPNGWEWWLVYMANTAWKRSQFVDRIHFVNGRMTVDGITGPGSRGFHPAPAAPQYSGTSLDGIKPSDTYLLELTSRPSDVRPSVTAGGTTVCLPDSMPADVAHEWRIEKNHSLLTVWIDQILVADHVATAPGDSGLSMTGQAEYLSYNDGWDEYADKFSGWDGLEASSGGLDISGPTDVRKGPAASDYEFSVGLDNLSPDSGRYGVYAYYADDDNYVRVTVDASRRVLVTENRVKGRTRVSESPLARTSVAYPDVKYSDNFEKQYRFDAAVSVSSLQFPRHAKGICSCARHASDGAEGSSDHPTDIASLMDFAWLDGDTWRPLHYEEAASDNPGWQKIAFVPVRTKALRMINKGPHDECNHIYRIKTGIDFSPAVQLRVEKTGSDVRVFVDNRELSVVRIARPRPSRVGLFSDGKARVRVTDALWYSRHAAK